MGVDGQNVPIKLKKKEDGRPPPQKKDGETPISFKLFSGARLLPKY